MFPKNLVTNNQVRVATSVTCNKTIVRHSTAQFNKVQTHVPEVRRGSRANILNEARGVDPGCVEIIPRNLVTVHVLT